MKPNYFARYYGFLCVFKNLAERNQYVKSKACADPANVEEVKAWVLDKGRAEHVEGARSMQCIFFDSWNAPSKVGRVYAYPDGSYIAYPYDF